MDVVVAMSGGVDSSVAAALLQQAGHRVAGVTLLMEICREGEDDSLTVAQQVAGLLGVDHRVVDCRQNFEKAINKIWDETHHIGYGTIAVTGALVEQVATSSEQYWEFPNLQTMMLVSQPASKS